MDRSDEALSTAECWELVAMATLGRLALSIRALPTILPVRYVVDDASVVISIVRLGMPDTAVHDSVVAFAVDDINEVADEGWMVQMQGRARLTTATTLAGGPGDVDFTRIMRLSPGTVTGLRYSPQPLFSVP
jgi:nitroimidazol reductase NimA-like FMN-containing flavoprotein (pyridoxamine 5'-phosphate oxidase superfamily)